MTATYATELELARFLNIEETIPDRKAIGSARVKEVVGTGDNSTTLFYLDRGYVINGSYTFYHGAAESGATALVEDTEYSFNKNDGTITLTSTGVTNIGTGNIYASYSYNGLELTSTQMQDSLDRAQDEIDKFTGTHWADGTASTPDFLKVTEEKHTGQGKYNRDYYTDYYPIPNFQSNLNGALAGGATAVVLDSTDGFPSSGYITVETDKIKYNSKDGDYLLDCSGVATAHNDGVTAYPYVIEISTTESGSFPTWTTLSIDDDVDVDFDTGKLHLYVTDYDLTYYALQYPPNLVPNRIRFTYLYGHSTIPTDIKRACLMMASKDLIHSAGRKSLLSGQDFDVTRVVIDDDWINNTLEGYKQRRSSNI